MNMLKKYECVDDDTVLEHSYFGSLDCSQPMKSVVYKNGVNASINCGGSSCFTFVGFECAIPVATVFQPIPLNVCVGGVYCQYCASDTLNENMTDSDSFCELYAPTDVACAGDPIVTAHFDGQCHTGTLRMSQSTEPISLQILRLSPGILEDEDEASECLPLEMTTSEVSMTSAVTSTITSVGQVPGEIKAGMDEHTIIGICVGVGCALLLVVLVFTVVAFRRKKTDARKHFYKSEDNLDYEVLLEADQGSPQLIDNTIHGI